MYKIDDIVNTILHGESLEKLKNFPEKSIDMCITSPPYWGLRDYETDEQLGLEKDFNEYIDKLCNIFDEIYRLLKDEGSCWVNIGDTYNGSGGSGNRNSDSRQNHTQFGKKVDIKSQSLPTNVKNYPKKCLCMIPQRFAIEMINRGWILRNTIIWHKKSCMPSSVKDRFTTDFEYMYFFVKQKKYYFKQQLEKTLTRDNTIRDRDTTKLNNIPGRSKMGGLKENNYEYKNKRTVWTINPKPFKEAHFAVYPEELVRTPIDAGCPKDGIVIDPFFGSGTTGKEALNQNKNFIGIELNYEYIKISKNRLEYPLNKRYMFRKIKKY